MKVIGELESYNYSMIISVSELYPICKNFNNLKDSINELNNLLLKLRKYSFIEIYNNIELLNQDEKETYKRDLKKFKPFNEKLKNDIAQL